MTKLLVGLGLFADSSTEVINLDESKPDLICDNLPDMNEGPMYAGTGQLYKEKTPIICVEECFALENGNWTSIPNLTGNGLRTSVVFKDPIKPEEDVLLVAGGNWNHTNPLKEVLSFDGNSWNEDRLASLPEAVLGNCLVKINDSMLMSIGGTIGWGLWGTTWKTHFFDTNRNYWFKGPNLKTERRIHSCGVLNWQNPKTGLLDKVVVVAGGKDKNTTFDYISSVELLFMSNFEAQKSGWVMGPKLPKITYAGVMIEFQNSVILVGGVGKYAGIEDNADGQHLYKLSSPDGPWIEMKQTLKERRDWFVAFLIPDELVTCHQP